MPKQSKTIKPIRTREDYEAALRAVDSLMGTEPGGEAADTLEVLSILISDYEDKHFPISPPDPVEYLLFLLENGQLNRKDLGETLGCSKGRISEILNRSRTLSLQQMVRLWTELDVPAESLLRYAATNKVATEGASGGQAKRAPSRQSLPSRAAG